MNEKINNQNELDTFIATALKRMESNFKRINNLVKYLNKECKNIKLKKYGGLILLSLFIPVLNILGIWIVLGVLVLISILILAYTVFSFIYIPVEMILILGKLLLLLILRIASFGSEFYWLKYACPYGNCSTQGKLAYLCPCGIPHQSLLPSLYGLFHLKCYNCETSLPTLDLVGKRKISKCCAHCGRATTDVKIGVPVRQYAIIGNPLCGKTSFFLAALQQMQLESDWLNVMKKFNVPRPENKRPLLGMQRSYAIEGDGKPAVILHTAIDSKEYNLYFHDPPGDEYSSITGICKHHYLGMLDGLFLIVDPTIFSIENTGIRERRFDLFTNTVHSTINRIMQTNDHSNEKMSVKIAVVITKMDSPWVKKQFKHAQMTWKIGSANRICRQILIHWGCENIIRSLELRFEQVEYFTCSASDQDRVMEPFTWMLKKE